MPTRFSPYPAYKSSGVPWLGSIPAHWEVRRLKQIITCLDGKRIPLNSEQRGTMQGEYPYWGANSIVDYVDRWLFDEELVLLGEDGAPFFAENKQVAFFVNGKIWVNNHAHVLRPDKEINPIFLAHVLNIVEYRVFIDGSTRDKLTQSDMSAIPIQVPPLPEQRAIAAFLDRETARLDTLIAKKEQLIERLQEKRTALISRAVTKGLDANASMKDSGVEWLGEVPERWEVRRLKQIADVNFSGVDKHSLENEIPAKLCNYVDVYKNERITSGIEFMRATASADEIKNFTLAKDDILITKDSESWTDIAVPAIVTEELENVLCGYHLALVRPNPKMVDGEFLFRAFQATTINYQFQVEATGITRYGIDQYAISNTIFPLLPIEEQRAIATYLNEQTARLDALVTKIQAAIARLREYRGALIAAAVTGKVDVRDTA